MKKIILLVASIIFICACAHTTERIIGYNEQGKTIVEVCKSTGNLSNSSAFGSSCKVELRDYGRISNKANTYNIISQENR